MVVPSVGCELKCLRPHSLVLERSRVGLVESEVCPSCGWKPLVVMAIITSQEVDDADDVPMYSEGVCRYWGSFSDSPLPDVRLFVVFNREPLSEVEAFDAARRQFVDE